MIEQRKKNRKIVRSEGTKFSATVFSAKLSLLRQTRNTGKSKRYDRPGKMESAGIVESCWNPMSHFFDTAEETLEEEIQQRAEKSMLLSEFECKTVAVSLFQDVYCDYQLVANHLYNFMKRKYPRQFLSGSQP